MEEKDLSRRVAESFAVQLNEHGHGFHYAVLNRIGQLEATRRSQFEFEVSEFPVDVVNSETRIDFILRHKRYNLLLVAECKRANAAYGDWCFIRAPYARRNRSCDVDSFERLNFQADSGAFSYVTGAILPGSITGYSVALPVSIGRQGDSGGQPRRMIEDAATQVSRGVNGLVRTLARSGASIVRSHAAPNHGAALWLLDVTSVIFTTARLWTTNTELSATDLVTGNLSADQLLLKEELFVAYQYHVSPGIRHGVNTTASYSSLGEKLDRDFMRTIWVVSATGIEAFLARDWGGHAMD